VSAAEIDAYIAALDEPKRSTLEAVRATILQFLPDAEQGLAYNMPAFRVNGALVAGFAAFKNHLSYVPYSGGVIERIPEAAEFGGTRGMLHFPVDRPLPAALVGRLVEVRLQEVEQRKAGRRSGRAAR
jgi:uncharacterized protein YdhG (YjbR/CyaY superfamily)